MIRASRALPCLLAIAFLGGCIFPARQRVIVTTPPPEPLPALTVDFAAPPAPERQAVTAADPLASIPQGSPITLAARNVDVRVLLLALAEQAGISLVIDPSIESRTTVNFTNVPAAEALRAVLASANLGVVTGPPPLPFGPTVFYTIPVNIDEASAELIQARYRVSPELARWIVESRPQRP